MNFKDKSRLIKISLLVMILMGLTLPILQQITSFVDLKPLEGSFEKSKDNTFSVKSWFDGDYQISKEAYLNENFGFRNLLVRLNNQVYYSFFNTAKANGVIVGKNNYLYEERYINSFLGTDFIGYGQIESKVQKFKVVQDSLKKLNIDLILILAPGKGAFYSEHIPDSYLSNKKDSTNIAYYVKALDQQKATYINFHEWFIANKNSSDYPLYPKTGIHWSKYGELLAMDSVMNFVEKVRGIELPKLVVTSNDFSTTPIDTDDDIERSMNLLFDIKDLEMKYPKFQIEVGENSVRPKLLVIGDSYYWGMHYNGLTDKVFNNGEFWYYNQQRFGAGYDLRGEVSSIDFNSEVIGKEVILLVWTDSNLGSFSFGFLDKLHTLISQNDVVFQARVKFYENAIKADPNWLKSITQKAKENSLSLDEMIRIDAEYMARLE